MHHQDQVETICDNVLSIAGMSCSGTHYPKMPTIGFPQEHLAQNSVGGIEMSQEVLGGVEEHFNEP